MTPFHAVINDAISSQFAPTVVVFATEAAEAAVRERYSTDVVGLLRCADSFTDLNIPIDPVLIRVDREKTTISSLRIKFVRIDQIGPLKIEEVHSYISTIVSEHEPDDVDQLRTIRTKADAADATSASFQKNGTLSCFANEIIRATHSGAADTTDYPMAALCCCLSSDPDPAKTMRGMYLHKKPTYPWGKHMDGTMGVGYLVLHDGEDDGFDAVLTRLKQQLGPSSVYGATLESSPTNTAAVAPYTDAVTRYRALAFRDSADYAAALSVAQHEDKLPAEETTAGIRDAVRKIAEHIVVRSMCNQIPLLHTAVNSLQPLRMTLKSLSRGLRSPKTDGAASIPQGSGAHNIPPAEYGRKLLADMYACLGFYDPARELYAAIRSKKTRTDEDIVVPAAVERTAWTHVLAGQWSQAIPLLHEAADLYLTTAPKSGTLTSPGKLCRVRALVVLAACYSTAVAPSHEAANSAATAATSFGQPLPAVAAPLLELAGTFHLQARRLRKAALHLYMASHRYNQMGSAAHSYRVLFTALRAAPQWKELRLAHSWALWQSAATLGISTDAHVADLAALAAGDEAQQKQVLEALARQRGDGRSPTPIRLTNPAARLVACGRLCDRMPTPLLPLSGEAWNTAHNWTTAAPALARQLCPALSAARDRWAPAEAFAGDVAVLHVQWANPYRLRLDVAEVAVRLTLTVDGTATPLTVPVAWVQNKGSKAVELAPRTSFRGRLGLLVDPSWVRATVAVVGLDFSIVNLAMKCAEDFSLPLMTVSRSAKVQAKHPNPQLSLNVMPYVPRIDAKVTGLTPASAAVVHNYVSLDLSQRNAYSGMLVQGEFTVIRGPAGIGSSNDESAAPDAPVTIATSHRAFLHFGQHETPLDPATAPYPPTVADAAFLNGQNLFIEPKPAHMAEATITIPPVPAGAKTLVPFTLLVPPVDQGNTKLKIDFAVESCGRVCTATVELMAHPAIQTEVLPTAGSAALVAHCTLDNKTPLTIQTVGMVASSGHWEPASTVEGAEIMSNSNAVLSLELSMSDGGVRGAVVQHIEPQYPLSADTVGAFLQYARLDRNRNQLSETQAAINTAVRVVSEAPPAYIDSKEKDGSNAETPFERHRRRHSAITTNRAGLAADVAIAWTAVGEGVSFFGLTPIVDIVSDTTETGSLPRAAETFTSTGWRPSKHFMAESIPLVASLSVDTEGDGLPFPRVVPVRIMARNVSAVQMTINVSATDDRPPQTVMEGKGEVVSNPMAQLMFAGATDLSFEGVMPGAEIVTEVVAVIMGPGEFDLSEHILVGADMEFEKIESTLPRLEADSLDTPSESRSSGTLTPVSADFQSTTMKMTQEHPVKAAFDGSRGFICCDMQGRRIAEIVEVSDHVDCVRLVGTTLLRVA
ncbi:TRAPP III complex, Trs85 [Carpediemonas membranifera]|uniref:TRAPP III complex, Trs85 n=1 Tax=Carpediemonas membranifera TaxID=201153 RepID=A0A8J6E4G6_9EUKA|nr:TRAPP III complex, Trs85 [Carpediemonas membranifera]|eukprot:KAG9394432.1 TRAPP III complex, Trs85 [Carpediemonas membranifera]